MLQTLVCLRVESPAEVAESIRQFLQTQVAGIITKVSPKKFSVKAHVFHEVSGCPMHCLLKARVWRSDAEVLVEFCRRRGDSLVFQNIFQKAVQFLMTKFDSATEAAMSDVAPPPAPKQLTLACSATPSELLPLFDMLNSNLESAQAEAIASLVAVATLSTAGAAAVCDALLAFSDPDFLTTCIESSCSEVSFPAMCLQSTLGNMQSKAPPLVQRYMSCAAEAKRATTAFESVHARWTEASLA